MKKSDVELFEAHARLAAPDARFLRDFADQDDGTHWLTIVLGPRSFEVEFRDSGNVCFHLGEEMSYGERPDEIFEGVPLALHRFAQLYGRAKAGLGFEGINAVELRKLQLASQKSVAERMHVSQASVSQLESRLLNKDAFKISTLRDYVESLGGKVEINLIFPHFRGNLEFGSGVNDYEKFMPENAIGLSPGKLRDIA